jgi:hypothetical protein
MMQHSKAVEDFGTQAAEIFGTVAAIHGPKIAEIIAVTALVEFLALDAVAALSTVALLVRRLTVEGKATDVALEEHVASAAMMVRRESLKVSGMVFTRLVMAHGIDKKVIATHAEEFRKTINHSCLKYADLLATPLSEDNDESGT